MYFTSTVGIIAGAYIPGTKVKSNYSDPQTCYPKTIWQRLSSPTITGNQYGYTVGNKIMTAAFPSAYTDTSYTTFRYAYSYNDSCN